MKFIMLKTDMLTYVALQHVSALIAHHMSSINIQQNSLTAIILIFWRKFRHINKHALRCDSFDIPCTHGLCTKVRKTPIRAFRFGLGSPIYSGIMRVASFGTPAES